MSLMTLPDYNPDLTVGRVQVNDTWQSFAFHNARSYLDNLAAALKKRGYEARSSSYELTVSHRIPNGPGVAITTRFDAETKELFLTDVPMPNGEDAKGNFYRYKFLGVTINWSSFNDSVAAATLAVSLHQEGLILAAYLETVIQGAAGFLGDFAPIPREP